MAHRSLVSLLLLAPIALAAAQTEPPLEFEDSTKQEDAVTIEEANASAEPDGTDAPDDIVLGGPGSAETRLPNPVAEVEAGGESLPVLAPHEYVCEGSECCDYTCPIGGTCCRSPKLGYTIAQSWMNDLDFPTSSCIDTVGARYDDKVPCSEALPALSKCSAGSSSITCGYGLACVATSVREASCLPICGRNYLGGQVGGSRLEKYWLGAVAAGCKEDGQAAEPSPRTGPVSISDEGIAVPDCVADFNLGSKANVATPTPTPTNGTVKPQEPPADAPDVAQRKALARQVVGLSNVYYEGKRAGLEPRNSQLFPGVWESRGGWKVPSFTNICSTYTQDFMTRKQRFQSNLHNYGGYLEAGTAVIVTGTTAFTAVQWAIGALLYERNVAGKARGAGAASDPEGCLDKQGQEVMRYYRRQMRFVGRSLVGAIVQSAPADQVDGEKDFAIIVGVGDSSTFNSLPTWKQEADSQDNCYIATYENPAADVAAQVSAALAMLAKYFRDSPQATDRDRKKLVPLFADYAQRAHKYATALTPADVGPPGSNTETCTRSGAREACIGTGCNVTGNMGPCELYFNIKTARQQLFASNAALFSLTGELVYEQAANVLFDTSGSDQDFGGFIFLYNWNNVYAQGVVIMGTAEVPFTDDTVYTGVYPGFSGVYDKALYFSQIKQISKFWHDCTADGDQSTYCTLTNDGYAYTNDLPQGNVGVSLNAICAAGIYHDMAEDNDYEAPTKQRAACFMEQQLGYIFNHFCPDGRDGNTCKDSGFSMQIGFGDNFIRNSHDRDTAFDPTAPQDGELVANWDFPDRDNFAQQCGGIVSGNFKIASFQDPALIEEFDSDADPDFHSSDRINFYENEAAVDWGASLLCALGAYAQLPAGTDFTQCTRPGPNGTTVTSAPRSVFD